jgi:hypothetical protein
MRKKTNLKSLLVGLLISLFVILPACSAPAPSSLPEPSYSRSITENIMLALNEKNFTLYSQDFDPAMKKAMSQNSFEQIQSTIASKVGTYVPGSIEFTQAILQDTYTVVVYTAKFTDEPDKVTITISFQSVNGKNLVGGLYFNSPKLRN